MTFLITFGILLMIIASIAIRILVLPNGEFRGTCSTNNEFLRKQDVDCPVCGRTADEPCLNDKDGSGML